MTQKNRELSQFGSFLEVNNTNQNIGIATTGTPYIGIGTTNPQYKLHLVGDTNIDGTIYLNGTPIVDAALQTWIPDGSNIYRESGSVGIGTSVYPSTLSVLGDATFSDEITASGFISSGIVTASRFISTVTTGTAPFTVTSQTEVTNLNASFLRGQTPPSGSIVGTSDGQTLTNKTLNLSSNTLSGTISQFNTALSDADFATIAGTQTLTNKTLTSPTITSIVNSGAKSVPTGIGTFVITGSTGTVSSGMIADGTIVNADISASAAIAVSKLASSTISGITLGSDLNNLTAGSYITYNSGSTYNGSTARTIGVAATTANEANTLVARDASGDFSAGTISALNVNVDFSINSSDIKINDSVVIDSTKTLIGISSIGIGTDNPNNAIHIDVENEERQIIFDNGNSYCYFYLNTPTSPFGESFGFLDSSLSAYPSGGGSNRNLWYYSPPQGKLYVGDTIITDIDNLKVGIGSTQPAHKLDVSGAVAAKSYVTAGIVTTGNSTSWAVDASLTGHMYAEFDTNVECQIYNLFEGAEFKAFIKNDAGGTRDLTVVATDDTGPSFTAVRLSIPTSYFDNNNTIIIGANDVRVMTVMNIKGNYVGFVN